MTRENIWDYRGSLFETRVKRNELLAFSGLGISFESVKEDGSRQVVH